ncbi:MAG: hypothetical protein Q8L78_00680 [Coxiellaceae bacterium]|nr:hypothetical protein [Coxiellaceae bacterium]
MKKILLSLMISFLVIMSSLASSANDDQRYKKTTLVIKNNAPYPVVLTMDNTDGTWEIPVALKSPILLNENQEYQNTIVSIKKSNDLENFVSLDVAQADNAHENYLIFAENTSSKNQQVSADIFDGLGRLFVKSDTNYCNDNTSNGYAFCKLIIQDN